MLEQEFTPVPNSIFDHYIMHLKPTELAVLLVIVRQTAGWMNQRTKQRKHMDWISGSQLQEKTGYSRKSISTALEGLTSKELIRVTDGSGNSYDTAKQRQGKTRLYFALADIPALSPTLSPHAQNVRKTWVKISPDLRKKYAQQKKLLQKKLTQFKKNNYQPIPHDL